MEAPERKTERIPWWWFCFLFFIGSVFWLIAAPTVQSPFSVAYERAWVVFVCAYWAIIFVARAFPKLVTLGWIFAVFYILAPRLRAVWDFVATS